MWHASDEALIAGIAADDTDAARTFVRRHQQRVFSLALTILGDRQAAEDVAQETFLRVWRHAGGFDPRRASVVTWLMTIARNAAIDARRLRRPAPVDPDALVLACLPSTASPPEDQAVDGREIARVRVALEALPADQRDALLYAVFYGWTASEVAASQEVPIGTAKTRIRTALQKVRHAVTIDEARP